jgi:tripartite-type tricarboxylate transporter receptor subunit TctC
MAGAISLGIEEHQGDIQHEQSRCLRGRRRRAQGRLSADGAGRRHADDPTLIESGVPDYVMGSWQGVLAPAGTPAPIVKKLQLAIAEVLNDPAMRQRLEGQGAEVLGNTPEEFGALLAGQAKSFLAVGRQANVKPQ